MTKFTDQHLSAYIDGELPDDLETELRAALNTDPALANRLGQLEKANLAYVSAHGDLEHGPLPEAMLDLLASAEKTAAPEAAILRFPQLISSAGTWLRPLAAGLVMAIGIGIAYQLGGISSQPGETLIYAGTVPDNSAVHRVLETVSSGQRVDGIEPVLTYLQKGGGVCRELQTAAARSLACRDAAGDWTVLAVVDQGAAGPASVYRPASAAASGVFDLLADELMEGVPLSAEEEAGFLQPD